MTKELLITDADYKASGIYIGMKQRTAQMKEYIYRVRPDGLSLLNISKIDQKIRTAAKFLARHQKILIVARKTVAKEAVRKFSELTDAKFVVGRFMPGTLTNPSYKKFFEAEAILVIDPLSDYQALNEAVKARIPVIGICDTFNDTKNIDLIIPSNNKSVRALATLFWILAREVMKERGTIKSDEEFKYKIEDFAGDIGLDAQEGDEKKQSKDSDY